MCQLFPSQIEEILREKITEYWKPVSAAIMAADSKGDGYISIPKMKSIIDNCVLPVSEDHFKRLASMGFAPVVSECSVQLIKTNTSYIILIAFKWRYM